MNLLFGIYSFITFSFSKIAPLFALFNKKLKIRLEENQHNWQSITSFALHRAKNKKLVWMHCASLGEYEQGYPVIASLRKKYSHDIDIIISFSSPSGYEPCKSEPIADLVIYLPFDTKSNVNKLISILKPSLFIGVKYEFWWNLIQKLIDNNCHVIWIAVNLKEKHYLFSKWATPFLNTLRQLDHIFVQDTKTLKLLRPRGFHNVSVAGDPRIERIAKRRKSTSEIPLFQIPSTYKKVIIYGSIYVEDFKHIGNVINKYPDHFHIIVPHDVSKTNIQKILSYLNIDLITVDQIKNEVNYVIIDKTGLLFELYKMANVAYVGGGFGKGIHNILEPVSCGIAVSFGPQCHTFKEAEEIISLGLGKEVIVQKDFDDFISKYSDSPVRIDLAKDYFSKNQGSAEIILRYIQQIIQA